MDYAQLLAHKVDIAWADNNTEDGKRSHLGASVIGHKCMRYVWYSFHWCDKEPFEGRMLRLFQRGHKQEEIFAELLRGVGATVWTADANGQQFRVAAFGGHFGGSMDGVARGLPDLDPAMPFLLEFKTHNDKSFKDLVKKKVRESKPSHFKQAQIYMHLGNLPACLYCAVNKNDDSLYFELFQAEPEIGRQLLSRAETVLFGGGLPARITDQPSWFECKFCPMHGVCWDRKQPDQNCRTCIHSQAERDGSWRCELDRPEITASPKSGCPHWELSPALC